MLTTEAVALVRAGLGWLTVVLAITSCAGGEAPAAGAQGRSKVANGEWTMMRFLGGPPASGQVTDTLRLDPGAGSRHVRIERNRAGMTPDRSCEADASDDAAWGELLAALADPGLAGGLAHPDRVPLLVMDAGYFACTHAGTRIALSDLQAVLPAAAPETTAAIEALRRLAGAYQRVLAEVAALPTCKAL
jgi:hypothetical protein